MTTATPEQATAPVPPRPDPVRKKRRRVDMRQYGILAALAVIIVLFQVLTEREETNSVAIASNESFSGWTKTFTDPRLCAAIVDRLTFGGNIIETGTTSYRLAHARAVRSPEGS